MRLFKLMTPIFLIDLSAILGTLYFIFAPIHLLIIPVTALVALSVAYSIFEPLHRAALLATAFILIQYLLTSPLPLLGILSLAIVHHHIKNTLLPTQENKTEIPRGSQPRKSNFFGQVITYSPFSYAPILSLFRHDDDPFDGSDTYFIDINGST